MKFNAGEIASVIQKEIEDFRGQLQASEVGHVVEVGDGIARVYGLASAMAGEMVEFSSGVRGQVFNLEENSVGVIILGDYLKISEGDEVRTTGALLSVPVGNALIGRVVDPLGMALDGKGPVIAESTRPLETMAPGVAARQPVKQPLQTGIKAVDAMTPVGRGQRELIIGDRKTGKIVVEIDPKFFRPAEVELLIGDPAKAKQKLGWTPKVKFEQLVEIMMKADLEEIGKQVR